MKLKSYERKWDSEERRGLVERVFCYIDSKMEFVLAFSVLGLLGYVTVITLMR